MLPLLSKNLNLCFSIAKRPLLHLSSPTAVASASATTTSSSTPFNFSNATGDYTMKFISEADTDSDTLDGDATTPDFSTIHASHRFFFPSPGRSNSIVDSSSASAASEESLSSEFENERMEEAGGGLAVQTYSPDPYGDFRRSMEEMVEARGLHDVTASWNSLHELLLCYLSLNPKGTHKFIVAAFSDLLVSLLSPPQDSAVHRLEFLFPAGGAGSRSCGCSCD